MPNALLIQVSRNTSSRTVVIDHDPNVLFTIQLDFFLFFSSKLNGIMIRKKKGPLPSIS
jgi:hypothetical protein